MTDMTISIGQRIFNHGDMANVPHWGRIIEVKTSDWGISYVIETEAYTYTIRAEQLGHVYRGNGLTRIVTEEAYNEWHTTELAKLNRQSCSACSGELVALGPNGHEPIAKCASCGGLHTLRPIAKGALPINLFRMDAEPTEGEILTPVYFDLEYLDGATGELSRSHGWYDPDTLNVLQYG